MSVARVWSNAPERCKTARARSSSKYICMHVMCYIYVSAYTFCVCVCVRRCGLAKRLRGWINNDAEMRACHVYKIDRAHTRSMYLYVSLSLTPTPTLSQLMGDTNPARFSADHVTDRTTSQNPQLEHYCRTSKPPPPAHVRVPTFVHTFCGTLQVAMQTIEMSIAL